MASNLSDKSETRPEAPTESESSGEGFLSRWSRRKNNGDPQATDDATNPAASELSSGIEPSEEPNVTASTEQDHATADVEEEPLLTDEDMPAIETITSKSDMSMFFNRGVSRELRKAALKHLFGLPALNITDGLNDYDEDYTTFEPLGDIVTSDMRFHAERKARLAEEEEARKLAEAAESEEDSDETEASSKEVEQEPDAEVIAAEDTADNTDSDEKLSDNAPDGKLQQDTGEIDSEHRRSADAGDKNALPLQDKTNA